MGIQIIGTSGSGNLADVDSNGNLSTRGAKPPLFGASGGGYHVAGSTSAVVAAALAANTMLMSFRLSPSSTLNAYITRMRVVFVPATLGASGGVAGTLGVQRFTAQTPTGGTARTVARKNLADGSASQVTDIRDSNAALTGTAPTFGDVFSQCLVPLFVGSGGAFEWIIDMDDLAGLPLCLTAGNGIALRTQVAMAATQTWMYSYGIHWYEAP